MSKKHYLTESELRSIIKKVIEEQSYGGYGLEGLQYKFESPNPMEKFNKLNSAMKLVEYKTSRIYFQINQNCDQTCVSDKQDAMRHIAMSAYAATLFNGPIASIFGQIQELKGALRMFFRGSQSNPRFTKFDSNWVMNTNNNNIGLKLAQDYPNRSVDQYIELSKKTVESGNYYNRNNVYMKTGRR